MTSIRMRPPVIKKLRTALRSHLPGSTMGVLNESIAWALGFESHEELRANIDNTEKYALFDENDFREKYASLSSAPASLELLHLGPAIVTLDEDDAQPSAPEATSDVPIPIEWHIVTTAAFNIAIRRGLIDLELRSDGIDHPGRQILHFQLAGYQARCAFEEDEDRSIYLDLVLENDMSADEAPLVAKAELVRIAGFWLHPENMFFEAGPTQLKALGECELQRPLGFGLGTAPFSTLRDANSRSFRPRSR